MQTEEDGDSLIDAFVAARPEQVDPAAQLLRSKLRENLLGSGDEPFRFGRFVVLGLLGGGGMGVVFVAYDPDLDRKIALKTLRSQGEQARREMLREGRALARLRHPNVVGVYEVGVIEEREFVAMEYIEGANLRVWLRTPRPTEAILARLMEAGRGLAAAHGVGLVHRDFKPENLVIDGRSQARVIDFGLARPDEDAGMLATVDVSESPTTPSTHGGTPAYMSPERLAGSSGDARADQYAYCVTAWEALFGERPSAGVERRARPAPAWLSRALERGLAEDPADRWPSMEGLLGALERGRARARWRLAAAVLAALVLVIGAGVGAQQWGVAQRSEACEGEGRRLQGDWNDEVRGRLRSVLLGTNVGYAETTAERILPWLDEHVTSWGAARSEACMNTEVHRSWTVDTAERAAWCLEERRLETVALIEELMDVDPEVLQKAVSVIGGLGRSEECLDPEFLARQPAPPIEERAGLEPLRRALSRAQALGLAGKYKEALEVVREAREAASTELWRPLWAKAKALEAAFLDKMGSYEEAEKTGMEAFFAASEVGAWSVAADAATRLVLLVGSRLERHEEGLVWARHAEVAIVHAGDRSGLKEATRLSNRGMVSYRLGVYARAQEEQEQALALTQQALGEEHPVFAERLSLLAMAHNSAGEYPKAREVHARALGIFERALGPDHPQLALALSSAANVEKSMGAYDEAIVLHRRSIQILRDAHGDEHPHLAGSLANLASVYAVLGQHEKALEINEEALAIDRRAFGPEHPNVGISLANVAVSQLNLGALAEAQDNQLRALAIFEKALGPEHPSIASILNNIALIKTKMGRYDGAYEVQVRALAVAEGSLGPEHPTVAGILNGLGSTRRDAGRHEEALPLFERGASIFEALEGVQASEMSCYFNLARTLVETGGDLERAVSLALRALEGYREAERLEDVASVERWLKKVAPERAPEAAVNRSAGAETGAETDAETGAE